MPRACHVLTEENYSKNPIRSGVREIRNILSVLAWESPTPPIGIPTLTSALLLQKKNIDPSTEMMWRGHGIKPNKDINASGVKPNKDMNVYLETMKERGLKRARALFEHK